MNNNINKNKVKYFNKLARKSKSTLNKIRKFWFQDVRDNYMYSNPVSLQEANKFAKNFINQQSDKKVLEYWEDYHDCDSYVLPKHVLKSLTVKQMEILF